MRFADFLRTTVLISAAAASALAAVTLAGPSVCTDVMSALPSLRFGSLSGYREIWPGGKKGPFGSALGKPATCVGFSFGIQSMLIDTILLKMFVGFLK